MTTNYLDMLAAAHMSVGYGTVGRGGSLGYEDKHVVVRGQAHEHALSTHPPAELTFDLGGRSTRFHCQVAINDDVPAGASHAHFLVRTDGRLAALAPYVVAGDAPQPIEVDVSGVQRLSLVALTSQWEYCHAVWLDPLVDNDVAIDHPATLRDCLDRAEIRVPWPPPRARRCIATTVSPGFTNYLDDLLGSLRANGGCHEALVVVFAVDADDECRRVARKYGAVVVECRHLARVNPTVKSVLYTAARVIDADQFVCLDADMLVVGDLEPVFAAIDACPVGSLFACREANRRQYSDIHHALCSVYGGRSTDIGRITGVRNDSHEGRYPLVVNDGIFAGGRIALLALDGVLRRWDMAPRWVDERRDIWWRNQLVFNLALAHLGCGVELDETYNIQMNSQDVDVARVDGRVNANWHGRHARMLHYNGLGRHKNPEWRGLYARVEDPLAGGGDGDSYERFLSALRVWIGEHGVRALAWSFYGTADSKTACIRDPAAFPLFGLLHYLIRSNGCVAVLETGTARGVSAACLASAVAHRASGKVVSFDPHDYPGRHDLWAALPPSMRTCIEQRPLDSLQGMQAALEAGECYDAALLDSVHDDEHVWQEFQLAAQLVTPGGLILIHDPCLPTGSVDHAIRRIEEAGYGVAHLWTAESGEQEDDGLGLAVITNRLRCQPGGECSQ